MENTELVPALSEEEARQIVQQSVRRTPETAPKRIRKQTANSPGRLTRLLGRSDEMREINVGREMEGLIPVATSHLYALVVTFVECSVGLCIIQ